MNFSPWFDRLKSLFFPLLGALCFGLAAYFISHFLKQHSYTELREQLSHVSPWSIAASASVSALAYAVLSLYDVLAFRYIKVDISFKKALFGSFTAFAFSNSIGLANLAGSSVRMRLYSSFGVPSLKIIQVIAFVTTSFWLGFLALSGFSFLVTGLSLPEDFHTPPGMIRLLGVLFVVLVAAYLGYAALSKNPLKIRNLHFEFPSFKISVAQILIAAADWALAALALYLLLPQDVGLSYPVFLSIFLSAQVVAMITHVPGGVGILEAIVIYFVSPQHEATPAVLAALVLYRLLYYFAPLCLAGIGLIIYEVRLKHEHITSISKRAFAWVKPLAPSLSAVFCFVAGGVLLFSGATPNLEARSLALSDFMPLGLLELSHFLGSCLGVVLLVLSFHLMARNRGAWAIAVGVLIAGILVSLLKGFDFEEALVLSICAGFLYASRSEFHRPAMFWQDAWTPGWLVAVFVVMGGSIWLGFFSYRHVEYSQDLWWSFSFEEDAPRFLRATAGTLITAAAFAMARLLRTPSKPGSLPEVSLNEILPLVKSSKDTMANLALLGDKQIFASPDRKAFLMYAIQGRTWVVLGDPVGELESIEELIYEFRRQADLYGGAVVFYQVRAELLPSYIDLGLMFLKLGEEAHVPLKEFSLDGRSQKNLRQAYNKMKKLDKHFRIVPASEWSSISNELKRVSDAWLIEKSTAEKGFSLGYFDPEYLRHFSTAIIEDHGRVLAFANLWEGGSREELSVDLMRYDPAEPPGWMEHLMTEVLLWGKEQGYSYFNLGMAPLSGLEGGRYTSRWNRMAQLLYKHGERFYNFQGLRRYKEKFNPEWEPRFLAYSSKLSLPLVLKDLTLLISGGVKGAVTK